VASSQHHLEPAASPSATARAVIAVPNPRLRQPGIVATLKMPVNTPSVTLRPVVTGCPSTSPV
jgi:hypothetical protein